MRVKPQLGSRDKSFGFPSDAEKLNLWNKPQKNRNTDIDPSDLPRQSLFPENIKIDTIAPKVIKELFKNY